jgi:hypothetical protein
MSSRYLIETEADAVDPLRQVSGGDDLLAWLSMAGIDDAHTVRKTGTAEHATICPKAALALLPQNFGAELKAG